MKKNILLYSLSLLLLLFASCQQEVDNDGTYIGKGFSLKVIVDELETGVKTRASIPSATGEKTVNSLYLVFFEYKADGSGLYQGYYKVPSPSGMTSDVAITAFTDGIYNSSMDYSILAFANLEASGGNNGYVDNITDFLEDIKDKTEKSVINSTLAIVSGVGTDEDDDSRAISSGNLLMSGSTSKLSSQTTSTVNLRRGVSRFDVENKSARTLVSVSIWGAASTGTVWEGRAIAPEHLQRFYGIKGITGTTVSGGLYSFENTVIEPTLGDKETTCLIIGLNDGSKTTYYRANIHPADEGQSLQRNYCYKITILSADGDGTDTEYEAWTQAKNQLNVTVNAWNLDDNGMILTDGTNTLGIPVKRIRLDSRGDIREYSIYTVGTGTLQITKSDLPAGITAEIVGNVLRVTGTALTAAEEIRRGNIEISFAGLRGSVDIIQEPSNDKVLSLDRVVVANFGPIGRYGMTEGPLTVTASSAWTAEIINTYDDAGNPGFSFYPSGDPVTKLKSVTNPYGDKLQIYTTGDNPYINGEERSGFIIVSLDEDPENYSIAVPLIQDKMPTFEILPVVSEIRFNPDGTPSNTSIANGEIYEFTVNSSEEWTVALDGGDDTSFKLDKPTAKRFVIKAKGANAGTQLSTTIKVANTDNTKVQEIKVYQEAGSIKVTVTGQVPTAGGTTTLMVDVPAGLAWTAELEGQWYDSHKAFISTENNTSTTGTGPGSFTVGFGKLYYPYTNVTPVVKVKVTLTSLANVYQVVEVMQIPFKPTAMQVLDVRTSSWGSLGTGSAFTGYPRLLNSTALFGPNGKVKSPAISIKTSSSSTSHTSISEDYRYLHAGGRPEQYTTSTFSAIETWRLANDGIVVFVCDDRNSKPFQSGTTLGILGYSQGSAVSTPRIKTDLLTSGSTVQKNIMKYLLQDGPFGVVNNAASLNFTHDGVSNTVTGYPTNAVPVIVNRSNPDRAVLVIDPDNRLVYLGEAQMFDSGYSASLSSDKDRFLANLLAYVVNAAQKGSMFTNAFKNDTAYKEMLGK